LSAKIHAAPGNSVVAIVGAGHVPGIKEWLGKEIDLTKLEEIPTTKPKYKLISWLIPLAFLALIIYGFASSGSETTVDMIKAWVLINGTLSAFGAAISFGHPITVISAFIVAPFTSLNPFIASGWIAAFVEAYIRKPLVS